MRLLIFGFGYSASAVAHRLAGRCSWIGGTTRSAEKAAAMAGRGIEPFLFDGCTRQADLANAVRAASHVLVSIAPTTDPQIVSIGRADPVLAHFEDDILAPGPDGALPGIVYLSTIGVYGDAGGRWVDEFDACQPNSARAIARRTAEESWLNLWRLRAAEAEQPGSSAVLRLSGIYGPGRNTFINLAAGTARRLVKPGQVFNRIHVEDIAQAVELCFERRASGIFNITDDGPAPPQDVVAFAAALMGIEPPPEQGFATADLSPMARSFYGSNKRVSNQRSKTVLGMRYAYPDYRSALTRMWTENTWRAAPGQPA